jgi:hypothetical protein
LTDQSTAAQAIGRSKIIELAVLPSPDSAIGRAQPNRAAAIHKQGLKLFARESLGDGMRAELSGFQLHHAANGRQQQQRPVGSFGQRANVPRGHAGDERGIERLERHPVKTHQPADGRQPEKTVLILQHVFDRVAGQTLAGLPRLNK